MGRRLIRYTKSNVRNLGTRCLLKLNIEYRSKNIENLLNCCFTYRIARIAK